MSESDRENDRMIKLVIGGFAQGKLQYVQKQYENQEYEVFDGELPKVQPGSVQIVNHVHDWIKAQLQNGKAPEEELEAWLTSVRLCEGLDCVLISDEIGNGIVPMQQKEREYRERTGRILINLAKEADEVVRVVCGIGQRIK